MVRVCIARDDKVVSSRLRYTFEVPENSPSLMRRIAGGVGSFVSFATAICANIWAAAALFFNFPAPAWRVPVAILYSAAILGALIALKSPRSLQILFLCFRRHGDVVVFAQALQNRNWQPDVAETAWAEMNGNQITIHNLRYCDYRTETDYTPRWETRNV